MAATIDGVLFTGFVGEKWVVENARAVMHAHIPHKKRAQLWVWLQRTRRKDQVTTHFPAAHVIISPEPSTGVVAVVAILILNSR